jgi:hypothetical protein
MKTIQIKIGVTIGFITDSEYIDGLFRLQGDRKRELIGTLSKITEEQAKELVPQKMSHLEQINGDLSIIEKDYKPLELLKMAAEALDIKPEEFNQYLVVKL